MRLLSSRSASGFPGGSDGKESACNAGDLGSISGLGRSPGGRHGNPLQYSCLENLHGQRSLAGYSLWGCKQLDMTEQLSMVERKIPLSYLISHRIFDSIGLVWGWRICISEKFSGEVDATGLCTLLLEPLENQCCRHSRSLKC